MSNPITDIEEKILEELNQEPLSSYCNFFKTCNVDLTIEDFQDLQGELPACLVSYVGDQFKAVTSTVTYKVENQIFIFVLASHLRDSDSDGEGIFTMLNDVKTILHKSDLGGHLDVPMILKDRGPLEVSQTISLYSLTFEVEFLD